MPAGGVLDERVGRREYPVFQHAVAGVRDFFGFGGGLRRAFVPVFAPGRGANVIEERAGVDAVGIAFSKAPAGVQEEAFPRGLSVRGREDREDARHARGEKAKRSW